METALDKVTRVGVHIRQSIRQGHPAKASSRGIRQRHPAEESGKGIRQGFTGQDDPIQRQTTSGRRYPETANSSRASEGSELPASRLHGMFVNWTPWAKPVNPDVLR